jgi:acetyl-CoA carboxylase carboxyltransferase component
MSGGGVVKLAVVDHTTAAAPEPRQLNPVERLELLCDEGSLQVIRSTVLPRRPSRRSRPGDGVVAGAGKVAGRPIYCYAQDRSFAGGSLGEAHAESIVRVIQLAGRAGVPVIGFVESAGARMDDGVAALGGYGRIFRETVVNSGRVPQITVVTGVSAGGGAYSPALTDFVVMTGGASMFLTGPGVVREVTGEDVDAAALGGPRVHARNGVCHFVAESDGAAALLTRDLLGHFPQRAGEPPPVGAPVDAPGLDPSAHVPEEARRVYDVRDVACEVVDGGRLLEVSERWARNMVTAFCRIAGRPVGLIANQPWYLGGVIDSAAAQKAARFVRKCDEFGLPLLVLVDTPGFLPGTRQEAQGVIRHGAGLLQAFAAATVPKLTVVLRKAFGGGFITMNSKDLGADLALAWPDAEIGIMGPRQAVGIVHKRDIAEADDPEAAHDRLTAQYADEHVSAAVSAREGYVDEVVEPSRTRDRIEAALGSFA